MGQYTQQLKQKGYELSPEDEKYTEKLLEVAQSFRSFDVALDHFIMQYGYTDDITNIEKKVKFIKAKFHAANIRPLPRNLKKWFTEKKRMEKRQIAYQFCFAFGLNVKQSEEFFRKVCLQRGFDCHVIEEAIYYYAIDNGLSYTETMDILEKAPMDKKGNIDFQKEVLFTESIMKEIHRTTSKEQLLQFFYENIEQFGYHNATAYAYIQKLWEKIALHQGIAQKELLACNLNVNGNKKRSVWDIYLQIVGFYDFDEDDTPLFVVHADRSLKPILKDNALLHPLAQDCFPDRQGLEAILRGERISYERVRKLLILLVFYEYWTKLVLSQEDHRYCASHKDSERCYAYMNRYLVDAGYPTLYEGNPYDWIFLFAMQDMYPMDTFRDFMKELYFEKEDMFHN